MTLTTNLKKNLGLLWLAGMFLAACNVGFKTMEGEGPAYRHPTEPDDKGPPYYNPNNNNDTDNDDSEENTADDDTETTESDDDDIEDESPDGTGGPNELQLPFPVNEHWNLTRAYNEGSHIDYGTPFIDERYALDFALAGCESWMKPIRPIKNGTVSSVNLSSTGFGNTVIVNHGDGYFSRYAHFQEVPVSVGQAVTTSTIIGLTGNSGSVYGSACPEHEGTHLHVTLYNTNGDGVIPEPMSGHTNFTVGCWYGHFGWIDCNGNGVPDEPVEEPGDDDDTTPPPADDDDDDDDEAWSGEGEDDDDDDDEAWSGEGEDDDDDTTPPPADDDDDDTTPPPADDDDDDDTTPAPSGGCDWTVPDDYVTIQAALDAVIPSGIPEPIICVEPGTYTEDLIFPSTNLTLMSTGGADATHIYGVSTDPNTQMLKVMPASTRDTVVQGFTLHGAGETVVVIQAGSPTLKNLVIECGPSYYGVSFVASGGLLQNTRINSCDIYGITVFYGSTGVEVENVIVEFSGNAGLRAGGNSDVTITNSVFNYNNYVGIWFLNASGEIRNTLVTSHTQTGLVQEYSSYPLITAYNTYYGNGAPFNGAASAGTGDLIPPAATSPLFTNFWAHDYTLQPGSPAINSGDPSPSANDANGTRNDRGAYGGPLSMSW